MSRIWQLAPTLGVKQALVAKQAKGALMHAPESFIVGKTQSRDIKQPRFMTYFSGLSRTAAPQDPWNNEHVSAFVCAAARLVVVSRD